MSLVNNQIIIKWSADRKTILQLAEIPLIQGLRASLVPNTHGTISSATLKYYQHSLVLSMPENAPARQRTGSGHAGRHTAWLSDPDHSSG
jgi:hypothetical protein